MDNKIKILKKGDLGRKKEKKVFFPKGRIVDEKAESEIKDLLKAKPKTRDMLIENLHIIQPKDEYKAYPMENI